MAASVLVDAGFLVAILSRRDARHRWAVQRAAENSPPWYTCEAVLSEAYHLLGERGAAGLSAMLSRRAVVAGFNLNDNVEAVVAFLRKYADVPMSFADACLVRMSETIAKSIDTHDGFRLPHLSPS